MMNRYLLLLMLYFLFSISFAQKERDVARMGNKNYEKGLFSESEVAYKKALSKNAKFEQAQFNLSDALFKQERYDESISILNNLISNTEDAGIKSDSYYNLGNNFLQQQKLEEAAKSYKNCLRLNPSDEEARYNLAKTLSLLNKEQQQENNQSQEDNQEDNQEKQDQNSGETDSQEDENNQNDANPNNQGNEQGREGDENQENQNKESDLSGEDLSRQEMERILDALEREEQKVQEEMKKMKVKSKTRTIEKDW